MWCKTAGGKPPDKPQPTPARAACKDKKEGSDCEFTPRNWLKARKGKCVVSKVSAKVLRCKPAQPAAIACKDKEEGSDCEYKPRPDMKPRKGQCAVSKDNEKVKWCKPVAKPTEKPTEKPEKPEIPPARAACKEEKEGNDCQFVPRRGMQPRKGTCTVGEKDGEEVLWCKPTRPVIPPPVAACKEKKDGSDCEVSSRKGTCTLREMGKSKVLWCKTLTPKPPPAVSACNDKDEGSDCEFSPVGMQPRKGKCILTKKGEKNVMWCKLGSSNSQATRRRRRKGSSNS